MKKENKKHVIEARGTVCPMPIIKLSQKMALLSPGEVVELMATDPGVLENVPAWCQSTGHECIEVKRVEDYYVAVVRKKEV